MAMRALYSPPFRRKQTELGSSWRSSLLDTNKAPRPRISFPHALAVGVAGTDEVMEFDVSEEVEAEAWKFTTTNDGVAIKVRGQPP